MSDFTQQEQQEARAEQLSNELNMLLGSRDVGEQPDIDSSLDPFGHVYVCLADTIIACSRMYIGLRSLEDSLTDNGGEDASQDTN